MSNGILPVQSVRGTLREWIMNNAFPHTNLGAEFFNRLMNLCNYDYPMSSALQGAVTTKFGLGLVYIINQYTTLTSPKLNTANRLAIRRVVPDEFYLEFIRLFDCDCCPAIIQQVADISYAVDGTAAGQLTVVEYIDGSTGNQVLLVYEWDGADWVLQIDTNAKVIDGEFAVYGISIDAGTWEVSVDGGVSWTDSDFIFDPPVSSFSVQFRNTVTGCTYSGWNMAFPMDINYCVIWSTWNNDEDPAFFLGTISGQSTGESLFILMGFNGNPTASYIYDASTYFFMSVYDSSTPAATNFGLYSNEFTDPPIVNMPVPIQNTSCERNCYRAVFNSTDLSTEGLTAISAFTNGRYYDWVAIVPFNDPTAAAQNLAGLISAGFLEPSATLEYSFNGLEVTVTVCSILDIYKFFWGTNLMNLGEADFTLIP